MGKRPKGEERGKHICLYIRMYTYTSNYHIYIHICILMKSVYKFMNIFSKCVLNRLLLYIGVVEVQKRVAPQPISKVWQSVSTDKEGERTLAPSYNQCFQGF